jgi:hypothetical protein
MDRHLINRLDVPLLPCLGNHENCQGEGIPELNVAYNRHYGLGWHNYLYTIGGVAFIVIDSSGAHRKHDEITATRNAFAERAFKQVGDMPVFVLTHVPLIALRDEAALLPSFGFSSWKVHDEALLTIVEDHADQVIAVLCGHIHLTAVKKQRGIYHIMPSGTAGYPADFATYDVYADHIEVEMQQLPDELIGDPALGDIHGARRHGTDYIDNDHPDHESYMLGNAEERRFTIELNKQPDKSAPRKLTILHETSTGGWHEVQLPT